MRGMKKWLPFKSLNGQYEILDEHQRVKDERISISDDQKEEIDRTLTLLNKGDIVLIKTYKDDRVVIVKDVFIKIDPIYKKIYLKDETISFDDLYYIEKITL